MIEALVVTLMAWIAAHSGLPVPAVPPAYAVQALADGPPAPGRDLHLPALVDDGAPIVLPRGWRADDAIDQSILLHALVHAMQARSGAPYPCSGEREAVAYRLQIAWLEARGINFFEAFDLDPKFVALLQRCTRDFDTAAHR
jgi:hypothetical protein